jgi:hypothetical protein
MKQFRSTFFALLPKMTMKFRFNRSHCILFPFRSLVVAMFAHTWHRKTPFEIRAKSIKIFSEISRNPDAKIEMASRTRNFPLLMDALVWPLED